MKLLLIVALELVPSLAHAEYDNPLDGSKLETKPTTELTELGFDGYWSWRYNNRVCGMVDYDNVSDFVKDLNRMGVTLAEAMTYTRCGTKIGAGQQYVEYGPFFHHVARYSGAPEMLIPQITKELIGGGNENVFINLMNGVGAENGRNLFSEIESMYHDPIHKDDLKELNKLIRIFCLRISRHEITELYQLAQSHGCSDIPPAK